MAQNKLKKAFPLRLRPDLIKAIKKAAKEEDMTPSRYVEVTLSYYHPADYKTEFIYPTYEGGPKHNNV